MKNSLLFILLLMLSHHILLSQCQQRYKQRYFNNIQIFRDVVYSKDAPSLIAASLTAETTIDKDLVMDIFMPPVTDTVSLRPAVVIAHGGGFINVAFMGGTVLVGTMDNDDVQALADTLAHWGYVAAVIEYRLGFNVLSNSSIKRAVWRATQDMSAALRFFRKNAQWFGVAPQRVLAAGSSAGAFCALHSTFVDYTERMPESYELVPLLKRDLGPLHSRPIVQLNGFNPFSGSSVMGDDVDSIPAAVAAYWGAIADLSWIDAAGNQAPVIMFHGTNDMVVDNECARPFSSVILVAPVTCGTAAMDSVLDIAAVQHEAYYAPGENHEYWGVLNGNWTPSGPNAYWPDIIQKTADFYYKILQPTQPSISGPSTVQPAVNYTYSVPNPPAGYRYCWEIEGGVIVSQLTDAASVDIQFYPGINQARVAVSAIDEAHFASDSVQTVVAVSTNNSINQLEFTLPAFSLGPNPFNTAVNIRFEQSIHSKLKLELYNTMGQMLHDQMVHNVTKGQTIRFPLYELSSGVYWLKVSDSKHQRICKINKL